MRAFTGYSTKNLLSCDFYGTWNIPVNIYNQPNPSNPPFLDYNTGCNFPDRRILKQKTALDAELSYMETYRVLKRLSNSGVIISFWRNYRPWAGLAYSVKIILLGWDYLTWVRLSYLCGIILLMWDYLIQVG